MGTGKTAVALHQAISSPIPTLILVNTRILSTWLDEIKRYNLYDNSVAKSQVLFVHSAINAVHTNYAKTNQSLTHKIIVTTQYYQQIVTSRIRTKYNLIIDEAHLFKYYWGLRSNQNIIEHLLISASPISDTYLKYPTYPVICKNFNLNKELVWDRVNVDKLGGKYAVLNFQYLSTKDYFLKQESLTKLVTKLSTKQYERIVIFSSATLEIIRNMVKRMKNKVADYYLLAFSNKAKTHMDIFRSKRCVVLCNYLTAIEGVNFSEADCAILYDFNNNSPEKARQSIGRIKRKNNTNLNIDIFFVINKNYDVEYIKSRLNQIYAMNHRIASMYKKSESSIRTILQNLKETGYDPKQLTDTEMLILFSNGEYRFDDYEFKKEIKMDLKELISLSYFH